MIDMPIHDWAQFALSVTFVFLFMAAVLWWLSKRKGGFLVNRINRPIQIEDTLQLGIKHKLMLVKVDEFKVLVSVTPNEMQTLHAWRFEGEGLKGSSSDPNESQQNYPQPNANKSAMGAGSSKSFKESLGDVNGST